MEILTKSSEETKSLGRKLASSLKRGEIVALTGNLGSGKTTFVQGLAEGLGIRGRIISPTFILIRRHEIPPKTFWHIDLYRLEKDIEKEITNIGIKDIWKKPENIVVIEWAEKIRDMVPKGAIWIELENLGKDKRKITIQK